MNDQKKNIVIKNVALTMGGGEKVLLDILKNIDKNKYNISLIIDDDHKEKNVFLKDVPLYIKTYFLRDNKLVKKIEELFNNRKKDFFDKLKYNYYLWKENQISRKNCIKTLNMIEKEIGETDVFVDFSGGARKYIKEIKAKKKILWRHLSMVGLKKKSKITRFGKFADNYDLIIAICNNMKSEIAGLLPYLTRKIQVIYDPLDIETIIEKSKVADGITGDEKKLIEDDYIITVSRLDIGNKDYKTLIEGYKIAYENGLRYKLYIIGDGTGKKYIQEMIFQNKLKDNIILLGSKKNPYIWVKKSKFFVLSSKEEGFGLVLAEAMALEKAVISSDCPVGPREILKNGNAGLLFPVGDVVKLSECLLNYYNDTASRQIFEKKGKERIEEYSLKNSIKHCEKIFDD